MKHSNKITIVIIVAAMLVFLFTACKDGKIGDSKETTGETLASTTETIPAQTGEATSPVPDGGNAADIGIEKAQSIVLAKVPGATVANIYEMHQEYDDGRLTYEGSIYYDGYEYDFEIDAANGNLLKWEIDD